jgi:hypothetical protein
LLANQPKKVHPIKNKTSATRKLNATINYSSEFTLEDWNMELEELRALLPKHMRDSVSTGTIEYMQAVLGDSLMQKHFRENLISYTGVLQEGRFKATDYVKAVMYVSYKLMGHSNFEAYSKTHPERFKKLVDDGVSTNTIHAYVAMYNKNKLVNAIFAQTMIPSYVLNQSLYQDAINVQAELMKSANSEKVRSDAANSLLIHLKPPEPTKVDVKVEVKQDDGISQLSQQVAEFVAMQKAKIVSGTATVVDVASESIIKPTEEYDNEDNS